MSFDFAEAKAQARQAVHDTLAVYALFKYDSSSIGIPITARPHSRLVRQGQVENVGAEVFEGIEQVVFDKNALSLIGIVPTRGNLVVFPKYQGMEVSLDYRLPSDGPVEEIWATTRL